MFRTVRSVVKTGIETYVYLHPHYAKYTYASQRALTTMAVEMKKLVSGYDIPVLGFGTYFGLPEVHQRFIP